MADKHYAGRWICQRSAKDCIERLDAMRMPYSARVKCPLAHKCAETIGTELDHGQLEHGFPRPANSSLSHELRVVTSERWNQEHDKRRRGLIQAFAPEQIRARTRRWRAAHRDQINEAQRRKRMELQLAKPPPEKVVPPCGGDCENCPWDDGCHFADWQPPPKWRLDYKKKRQRMERDLDYAARQRARANERNRRYRLRKKQQEEGCT